MAAKQKALVVTTEKGVFYGFGSSTASDNIRLTQARMIVYWSKDCRSVVGLAADGPSNGCRISPAAPAIVIRGVTAVIECSAAAQERFEAAPWSL